MPANVGEIAKALEAVSHERTARRIKADAENWKARCSALERELDVAEKRLEFVDAIRNVQQQRIIERTRASGAGVGMLVLSDWHCGEKVDPAQVQQLNAYSPAIFKKRCTALWQHAALMLDWARKLATIDTLIVWALGDFITGYIHEELRKSNYLSPNEETLLFQDELYSGLKFLRKEAGMKSIIVITKCGNHGRTTEKNQSKDEHKNSYEWLAYKTMERYFQIPGVSWRVEPGYHAYHTVNGRDYRGHHGHAIRYKGGVGGIYVPISQKLMRWDRTRPAYRDIMGHLHQYTPMTNCVVNSSLIGYTEYSISNGFSYEPPSQTLIVDSEKRGGIVTERIFCE